VQDGDESPYYEPTSSILEESTLICLQLKAWRFCMAEKVRIGIVGVGRFCSHYHIPNLLGRDDVEIPAVCDVARDRLEARDERLRGCRTFSDFRELLEPGLVDGVIVSTPNALHFEQCRLALTRGIHVLVDKPLTMTARQAEELVDISRRKDLVLMTAFTRHFMASVEHVRQHIVDGEIGALQMITAVQRRYPGREARLMGGMFLCRAVHIVDLCPWLTGRQVVRVEGRVEYGDDGYESFADIRMELEGGVPTRLLCIKESDAYQDEVSVYGTGQSFRIEQRRLYECGERGGWLPVDDLPTEGNSTAYFVDVLRGRALAGSDLPADPHGEDGLRALQVLEAVVEAGRTGRSIEVSS